MLDLDLLYGVDARVLVSTTSTTVTRIGEILLLPNEIQENNNPFEVRSPWEDLFVAKHWTYSSGVYVDSRFMGDVDVLTLNSNVWKNQDITRLSGQEFLLALIQQNENNGLQSAICSGCDIIGTDIDDELEIAIRFNDCEMNYNR